MLVSTHYDTAFYNRIRAGSSRSAEIVLPIVFEWLGRPASVVDVGCGSGAWLATSQALGVGDILGMDGEYVDLETLLIPRDKFVPVDLTAPPQAPRRFDLAISMEVGEHLPTASSSAYVRLLAGLSDRILFSAAIPGQGGVNHVNEQRPSFWEDLFAREGYVLLDAIRPQVWHNPGVEPFYAQNAVLFVKKDIVGQSPKLLAERDRTARSLLTIIYKDIAWGDPDVSTACRILVAALRRSLRRRLGI